MTNEQMKLVEDHIQLVHFVINKYLKFARYDEDAYQEGCLLLIKASKTYNPNKGAFSTIAAKYIQYGILQYYRMQKAQKRSALDNSVSIDAIEFNENIYQDKDFTNDLVNNLGLNDSLSELDEKQRVAVELYYLQGYSQPEIGRILGTSQVTVHRLLNRGLKSMKMSLSAS